MCYLSGDPPNAATSIRPFHCFLLFLIPGLWSYVAAQAPEAEVVWEVAAWSPAGLDGTPQSQATSGQERWHSIVANTSYGGGTDGFMAAGHASYPGATTSPGCGLPCPADTGCSVPSLAKLGTGGDVLWHRNAFEETASHVEGTFWSIIDTSDGGFLAVGSSHDRNRFVYNPTGSNGQGGIALQCWDDPPSRMRIAFAAKFAANGIEEWRYAYGQMNDPNDHLSETASQQVHHDVFYDVIERSDGGFRIVGEASDPGTNMELRAFVMDISANGALQSSQVYGAPGQRSKLMGIDRAEDDYVAAGTQFDGGYANGWGDIYVITLGATLAAAPIEEALLTFSPGIQDTGFDVAVAGDGSAHVASVVNCIPAGMLPPGTQCWRRDAHGEGDLIVHRVDSRDLSLLSTTSLGTVKAANLMAAITRTSDGGVAIASTKQPEGPIDPDPGTDNTDAFVAKLTSGGAVEWTMTYDGRTNKTHAVDGYDKRQQSVFGITDMDDDLLIVGYNTSNLEDYYAIRITTASDVVLPETEVANAHLVYPSATSLQSVLSGSISIAPTGTMWIDEGRTLGFTSTDMVRSEGKLQVVGATLTALDSQVGWGGINIVAGPSHRGDKAASFLDTVIEYVNEPIGALRIFGAKAEIASSTIRSSHGNGIYASGPGADILISNDSRIHHNNLYGIYATHSSKVYVHESRIWENLLSGAISGSFSTIYIWYSGLFMNGQLGAESYDSAFVGFWSGDPEVGYQNYGWNMVHNNAEGALFARGGGYVDAGTSFETTCLYSCHNNIYDHSHASASFDAMADDAQVAGEYNFWGYEVTSPVDLVLIEANYGLIYVTWVLTEWQGPERHAGTPGAALPADQISSGDVAQLQNDLRSVLLASRVAAAQGDHAAGILLLKHFILRGGSSEEIASAYGVLSQLLLRAQPDSAMGYLQEVAAGQSAFRPWALRALVTAYGSQGALINAEAAASTLVDDFPGSEHSRYGLLRLFQFRVAEHDLDAAQQLRLLLEVHWPVDRSVVAAGMLLDALAGVIHQPGRGESPGLVVADELARTVGGMATDLVIWPNPGRDFINVSFGITDQVEIRLVLYDLLGRHIALLFDGVAPEGATQVRFDTASLAAGPYVVRLEAGGSTHSRSFMIVR